MRGSALDRRAGLGARARPRREPRRDRPRRPGPRRGRAVRRAEVPADGIEKLREAFGEEIAALAAGVEKLYQLRVATRGTPREQNEILRKMVLGMVEDVRVVLIRLASRTQTLRWFAKNASA